MRWLSFSLILIKIDDGMCYRTCLESIMTVQMFVMKYIWSWVWAGYQNPTIMGDPAVALLVSRENGLFTPHKIQPEGVPDGWAVGQLESRTKDSRRLLRSEVLFRMGGESYWFGSVPGTRAFDYSTWSGYKVTVVTEKSAEDSRFASQLQGCGWKFQSQESTSETEADDFWVRLCKARDVDLTRKADEFFAARDAAKKS